MRPRTPGRSSAALLVAAVLSSSGWSAQVERLNVLSGENGARVEIGLSAPVGVDIFSLRQPDRLVVDLDESALQSGLALEAPGGGIVRAVRHGARPEGRLRVVFDLEGPVEIAAHFGHSAGEDGYLLAIDMTGTMPAVSASDPDRPGSLPHAGTVLAEASRAAEDAGGAVGGGTSGQSFVFGSTPSATPAEGAPGLDSPWQLRLDRGLLESGFLGASGRPARTSHHLQALVSASRPLGERWELRLGARLDGHHQRGHGPGVSRLNADYDETWLRYRGDDWRFTAGAQKVVWGRTDEISPTDRLSTKDLTRFGLDEMADRRRASPALRLEWFRDEWTVDALWMPVFRAAVMPDRDSIWHPVDRNRGRLLGLKTDPILAELVREGRFRDRVSGSGGAGVRVSRSGRGFDYAWTVQRARHSQPHYRMNEAARLTLLATGDPALTLAAADGPLFQARHPRTWVVGGDLGLAVGAWTWRFEAAWLSDVPVTRRDWSFDTVRGLDWVVGAETFPGDRDLRLTVQLAGMHLLGASGVLDRRSSYFLNGEIEDTFSQNRMRARMRFSFGLDRRDVYLNPEIAWIAWEPHELYLGLHWLDGTETALGGFYRNRGLVVLGWRGQF